MDYIKKEVLFEHSTDNIYSFVNTVIDIIRENVHPEKYEPNSSAVKQVIIELCTNAIKHSNCRQSIFMIETDHLFIKISKADSGLPFSLICSNMVLSFPLTLPYTAEPVIIRKDMLSTLLAAPVSMNELVFKYIEHDEPESYDPQDLLEHYGLLIIAKHTFEFTYQYDENSCTNIFKAVIRI
ncbi:hypothetical protein FW774_07190 [Pedobacter sp. BS3]|uniref:hypothetical protein n=1 Tax=Pedobacter sp. BS3 TaxID=2567937 RepID=UPI0011F07C64|nr:hypothetical protein [Pedobacter sp. BS3]TZF84759.1 hypothetical protein FW774_07190 [Pedobacter sp. BS3]